MNINLPPSPSSPPLRSHSPQLQQPSRLRASLPNNNHGIILRVKQQYPQFEFASPPNETTGSTAVQGRKPTTTQCEEGGRRRYGTVRGRRPTTARHSASEEADNAGTREETDNAGTREETDNAGTSEDVDNAVRGRMPMTEYERGRRRQPGVQGRTTPTTRSTRVDDADNLEYKRQVQGRAMPTTWSTREDANYATQ
ncbi:hypothetical protein BJ508DRAFT_314215 [Ascobolus immersus RN42]|uniref:Uncharacterized protein n=1 Tax=Ascobolus immersus RN42 TaxID=1160509 RepID=A0A3N4HFT7_ASCIM|nr:hypothetical protein BJ508DRAFT_314215 [Ascobolus immersus RN42]